MSDTHEGPVTAMGTMNTPSLVSFTPSPTDAEIAAELKQRVRDSLKTFCDIATEARQKHGMIIVWNIITDQLGRTAIGEVQVNKPL